MYIEERLRSDIRQSEARGTQVACVSLRVRRVRVAILCIKTSCNVNLRVWCLRVIVAILGIKLCVT